jgi:predicted RNA binding protein YcfA (HicA-like mRNA interferase family)
MTQRLPRITAVALLRALRRAGWVERSQVGSHRQLTHPARPGRVTVPIHAGEVLGPELLKRILRQAGLTAAELRALL